MRVSRAPERRGGSNKSIIYFLMVIGAVLIGVLALYMFTGIGSSAAKGDQAAAPEPATPTPLVSNGFAALPVLATPMPTAAPTPTAVPQEPEPAVEVEVPAGPSFVPDVHFGEVLSEGFVKLDLPSAKGVDSWYTYQVDTASREITLFFAVYNENLDGLVRTVKVKQYTQGQTLDNAEITVYYPEGPERIVEFDGSKGIMTLKQQYAKPSGPSLFTPDLRVALVNYGISMQDATGTIQTQLHLDVSGLSDAEGLVFQRAAPELVDSVLGELQLLVDQIESLRVK